jgi:hypothetical protein
MKLKHFLLIAGALGALGLGAIVFTCATREPAPEPEPVARPAPRPPPAAAQRPAPGRPSPAQPEPASAKPSGPSERAVDRVIMQYAGKSLGSDKLKDVSKGQPFKVNLYQDAGKATMNRAKIDLDRDDKDDEKWTFDGTKITRQVAPKDDENYSEKYVWNGEGWTKE